MVERRRTLEEARRILEQAKATNRVEPMDHAYEHFVRPSQMAQVLALYSLSYSGTNERTGEERYLVERDIMDGTTPRTLRLVVELQEEPPRAIIVSAHWIGAH